MKLTILTTILALAAATSEAQTMARRINDMTPATTKTTLQPAAEPLSETIDKDSSRSAVTSDVWMLPMVWLGRSGNETASTAIFLRNVTSRLADVKVEFLDEFGRRAEVPVVNLPGRSSILSGTMDPGEIVRVVTDYDNARLQHLHARLTVTPSGSISVSGLIGVDRSAGSSMIGLPVSGSAYGSVGTTMISSSADMRLVVSNSNGLSSTVTITATYPDGRLGCRATISVPAFGLRDFSARSELSCLRFHDGVVGVSLSSSRMVSQTWYHESGDLLGTQPMTYTR